LRDLLRGLRCNRWLNFASRFIAQIYFGASLDDSLCLIERQVTGSKRFIGVFLFNKESMKLTLFWELYVYRVNIGVFRDREALMLMPRPEVEGFA
jgi:hypothetical protein